jgi:hypothetical protein
MGGQCDEPIHGATADEMMQNGMAHLEQAHPQMAADIKATPQDDPKMVEWNKKFHEDFEKLPEDAA